MDHKAYLFRYDQFQQELAGSLQRSLQTDEVGPLRRFINRYRASLTDQETEEALAEDWEEVYGAPPDVQQYADLALTRYFDVNENLGLGHGFDALSAYLRSVASLSGQAGALICGERFGPKGQRLDPGQMGTGLVSPEEAARLAKLLASADWPAIPGPESEIYAECYYRPESVEEVRKALGRLVELYRRAAEAGLGILLMDFNERGVSHL